MEIDEIKRSAMQQRVIRFDIRGWIESNYDSILAPFPDIRINCPWCGDTKGRLYCAYADGRDVTKGMLYCHNEQQSYNFFNLFRDKENLTDAEAVEQLYSDDPEPIYGDVEQFLAQLQETNQKPVEEPLQVVWPTGYVRMWGLDKIKFDSLVQPYMLKRKIDQQMCDTYKLGYCTGKDRNFYGRVIIPIYQYGELVAYQGRSMHDAIVPKYRFMEGVKMGKYLYNLDNVPPAYDWVILVEGVFDVWAMIRAGFPNVIGSFGKHLTEDGIKTLVTRFKRVVILWDDDAKLEISNLAEQLDGMIDVWVSDLAGKDPDESVVENIQVCVDNRYPYTKEYKRMALIEAMSKNLKNLNIH